MEEWEQLLDGYPESPDLKSFIKMLKMADVVLKQDLAEFESEWIMSTLFFKPVNLFETVSEKLNDTSWSKPTADAFKVIVAIVDKYSPEHLYENIVTLCLLPYPPQTRKDALIALTRVTRASPEGAREAQRLITELEGLSTCKAQMAVLVGTICEHHPDKVTDSVTRIWRIYLNLLDSNKNTDTVTNSVLQGLLGLFKHFGNDLPIVEFRDLYEKLSTEYLMKGKCEEACLSILEQHSNLFKELVSRDLKLRQKLWSLKASPALRAVYETLASAVTKEQLQQICDTELVPRAASRSAQVRYTALRALRRLAIEHGVRCDVTDTTDVLGLELEARRGRVSLDAADAMQWCIESGALYSERLLQTAALFYSNIPASRRRQLVVHGLLTAPEDVRTTTTTLLITESCQNGMDQYLPLWTDIFDACSGSDVIVLERSRLVFADVMECAVVSLEAVLEEDGEDAPASLSSLLTVVYHILSLQPVEEYTRVSCAALLQRLQRLRAHRCAARLSAARAAHAHAPAPLRPLCEMIRIDKCQDEALLCESCNLLVYAPEEDVDERQVLTAIEILLTRTDVDATILSRALERLENIMNSNSEVDVQRIDRILCLVEKLRSRKDMSSKEARVLYRDVVLFMGKYGNNNYSTYKMNENTMIAELKDKLTLNIPNSDEGTIYKLNLQSILQLAVTHEEPEALQRLLSVICVALSSNKEPSLQLSLTLVIRALCRAHSHSEAVDAGSVQQAVLMCDSVPCLGALMTYISEEKSPGVRRMLSDALEGLLLQEPGSEATEQLVKVAAEHAAVMMANDDSTARSGGLNITDTLLSALKDNHLLQRRELPHLLTLILETEDQDSHVTFEHAYKIFLDNLEIYPKDTIDEIIEKLTRNLLKNYLNMSQEVERMLYKNKLKVTLDFFKKIPDFDKEKLIKSCKMVDQNFDLKLYLLASCGWTVSDVLLEEILVKVKELKCVDDLFMVEAVLKFMEVYGKYMFESKKELYLQAIENIISNITPDNIINLKKQLKSYTSSYDSINYADFYQNWCAKFNIETMLRKICKDDVQTDNCKLLKALNIYLDVFNIPSYVCDWLDLCDVALDIYVENGEDYIETHKEYMCDILKYTLRHKSLGETRLFILKSFDKTGVAFLRYFIEEFSELLLRKPYILSEDGMQPVVVVLNDLMKRFLKKKCTEEECIRFLELIDTIWPVYEPRASFDDKLTLLLQTTRLPVQLDGNSLAMTWAGALVVGGSAESGRLVRVLPGGEFCRSAYLSLAAGLPARLSEQSGGTLQALLDACAGADVTLLELLAKLCDCDQTKGWWDEAMASCMAVIARRGDCALKRLSSPREGGGVEVVTRQVELISIANALYEYPSLGVCKRLLIPFLRYTTPSFCEQFYSRILSGLLATLVRWVRGGERDHVELRGVMKEHARAFAMIGLALEKIPLASLKGQDSLLYSEVGQKQPSYLMKKVSSICVTLRKKPCPEGASQELKQCYRQWQVENYKCLCAAVSITRPAAKFYELLLDPTVWEAVFDCEVTWELPLQAQWAQQKSVHTVADTSTGLSATAGTSGTRTRMFLRTLSENPLQFDLMDVDEEPTENSQELELVVNELNGQDGADTLTALLRHVTSLSHVTWRDKLAQALTGGCHTNVKWTVAQAICNCKEEMRPHAEALAPPLLQMVADTPRELDGRKLLNNLHVDVLETILSWASVPAQDTHMSSAVEYLINTSIHSERHGNMLVSLLDRLLDVCGAEVVVPWTCFENYLAVADKFKILLRILLIVTKNKIYIPELLPALSKLDEKLWTRDARLPELFGRAVACASETERHVARYRHFLDRKRQTDVGEYVKLLYYAQLGCPRVCDEFHYKKIIDLTPKVPGPIKSKCLLIISAQQSAARGPPDGLQLQALLAAAPLEALRLLPARGRGARAAAGTLARLCGHGDRGLRGQAVQAVLRGFEDHFGPQQGEPSTKRAKPNTSKLLGTLDSPDPFISQMIECVALAVTDTDNGIASMARERVAECLSKDSMEIRLAEAFLIAIGVPTTLTSKNRSLSVCTSAFLDMLFMSLRGRERFKEARLRDEPMDVSGPPAMSSKLLSNTRTYQGTFLSSMRRRPRIKQGPVSGGINVQIFIEDILRTLLKFAKDKPDVSQTLCTEVIKAVLAGGLSDPGPLTRAVCDALSGPPGDATPLSLRLATELRDLHTMPDFESSLEQLRLVTRGTDGESLVQLLYEETMLRTDSSLFELGTYFEDASTNQSCFDLEPPSLQGLTSAFGKLANWDRLTERQRTELCAEGLPTLWVPEDTFRAWLDDYQVTNTKSWFSKLVSACRDECKQDSPRWLREIERWPRRRFDVSAVTEALQRQEYSDVMSRDIRPADCLVEWAARLMLRRAFPSTADSESSCATGASLAGELSWCRAANRRGLPELVLNCVEVHEGSVEPSEALSWKIEKACAMRSKGLLAKDDVMVDRALAMLECINIQTDEHTIEDVISMHKLMLSLHEDRESQVEDNLECLIGVMNTCVKGASVSKNEKRMACSVYDVAINWYDNRWPGDAPGQNDTISSMADYLGHVIDLDQPAHAEIYLALIFNRLDDVTGVLNEDTARNLLEKISLLIQNLDDTSIEQVAAHCRLFPDKVLRSYEAVGDALSSRDKRQTRVQQLMLVCDARHSLLRRVHRLSTLVDDPSGWTKTFGLLKSSIFENPHAAGTEYSVLGKYKSELYAIEDHESTNATQKLAILNKVLQDLRKKVAPRASLRLSQLCPALARYGGGGCERDGSMSRLLRLGKLGVVKFYEQVSVFCDAETRPVILQALLTDGSTRKYIHKTGDRLQLDAAAQRVARSACYMWGAELLGYQVTPLGEDSGLIEYVENTSRLRDLINSKFDLADVDIGARAEDEELILSSSSLEHLRSYCRQVPADALRSAIQMNCASTEDFINKKDKFLETLSTITVLSWLFGLGDRHLENILYSVQDGGLCCVDWSAMFQYGVRELPPARLTRNLLAVCDVQVLEARLQRLVAALRDSSRLFLGVMKVSFKWMGDEFFSKYPYIKEYASGRATSYDVTRQALLQSGRRYKERIVKLLATSFQDLEEKETYSVADQVICILRQCTDPKILSVTRSGWEPWL